MVTGGSGTVFARQRGPFPEPQCVPIGLYAVMYKPDALRWSDTNGPELASSPLEKSSLGTKCRN
jgi:hypothetical protein